MNPNGLGPTMDEDGFVLWESNSIVRHLASGHGVGGLCPADPRQRADAERWKDRQLTLDGPTHAPSFNSLERTPAEERNPATTADAGTKQAETYGAVGRHQRNQT